MLHSINEGPSARIMDILNRIGWLWCEVEVEYWITGLDKVHPCPKGLYVFRQEMSPNRQDATQSPQ